MTSDRLLREDREPIKLVPAAVRDVWFRPPGSRCFHTDGRGRCRSQETKAYLLDKGPPPSVIYLCARHRYQATLLTGHDMTAKGGTA